MSAWLCAAMCHVPVAHVTFCVPSHVGDALLGCAHKSHPVCRDSDKGSDADVGSSTFCQCRMFTTSFSFPGCSSSPSRRNTKVGLLGVHLLLSASEEPHSKPAVRSLLSLILFPLFGLIRLIRASKDQRHQQTRLQCINKLLEKMIFTD